MTDTPLSDDVVELVRQMRADAAVWGTEQAPLYGPAAEVIESLAARAGEMAACLKRLEAASMTIAGRLDMLGPRTEVGQAITEARALLSSIGASQP